ncbi:hypothetical protein ACTD5D_40930 [Nocardia takedensis]|uniref:hypothetical protein n=1 Tax=Nocardia takedensis TaxID=259390 RepID=UPI003F76A75C
MGVTAAGPLYSGQVDFAIIPTESAFALLQELAVRVYDADAPVSSSLAGRVHGEQAHRTWIELSTELSVQLIVAGAQDRVAFLRRVFGAVRASGRIDGLESVVCAAINASWPWLSIEATNRILDWTLVKLSKSRLAADHAVSIVDPNERTVAILAPGRLVDLDISEWRTDRAISQDQFVSGRPGLGPTRGDITGGRPEDRLGSPGGNGQSMDDIAAGLLGKGSSQGGVPGGLPSIDDLTGRGGGAAGGGQSMDDIAAGLLGKGSGQGGVPGGLPSLGDLTGRGSGPGGSGQSVDDIAAGWVSDAKGYGNLGPLGGPKGAAGIGQAGGPFGFGSYPGAEGASDFWGEVAKGVGKGMQYAGGIAATIGGGYMVAGAAQESTIVLGVTGTGTMITGAEVVGVGTLVGLVGVALTQYGESRDKKPDDAKPAEPKPDAKPAEPKPDTKPAEPKPQPSDPEPEEPKPGEPHDGDLYPDPDGSGGGGPTTIWDDVHGGGGPTTMWDDVHGGGGPTTIWDDVHGGGGPTMKAAVVSAPALLGAGLRAGLIQVNRATLRF